jgi:alkylation response protein AidB-like acyl-CoA dehydrogenase
MTMFELSENQKQFQEAARTFALAEMAPHAGEWDTKKHFPKDVIRKAAEMGFLGVYLKEDVGGLGLGRLDAAIIFEELAAGCTSTTAYITIHNMVAGMIDKFGSEELRQQFCPQLANGELLGSYCLTEANSGSDAASLKTRAEKNGNEYILTGSKVFVSGGGATDVLIVMARTGDQTAKGITAFVVPANSKGISFGENEKKMGWNSQPTRVINFDNVVVSEKNMLGQLGEGFKIALNGLDGGRINIGTCSIGCAQAALHATNKYMNERKQFGKPLKDFQALQFKVADMFTEVVAARQMVRLAAWKFDNKDPQTTIYCAMAKRYATDIGFKVCNEAIQLHGGYGYTQDYPVERLMRDSRVHQILEGTNEIMRVIISRKVLEEGAAEIFR